MSSPRLFTHHSKCKSQNYMNQQNSELKKLEELKDMIFDFQHPRKAKHCIRSFTSIISTFNLFLTSLNIYHKQTGYTFELGRLHQDLLNAYKKASQSIYVEGWINQSSYFNNVVPLLYTADQYIMEACNARIKEESFQNSCTKKHASRSP
ncbi:MAG: hypothetical protein H0W64_09150 [Gammaproteobacteria bacterium]|nr:hypothetical protein [Gammaproteobacteria bacterium]